MARITVVTSVLGGWDNLHPPSAEALRNSNARYVAFVDDPLQPACPPWEFRPAYTPLAHTGRNSRIPKILPHLMLDSDTEYSVWHDGCFALRERPEKIIADTLDHGAFIAAHKHPATRSCLYEEAALCIEANIGDKGELSRQMITYELRGHPKKTGLWACGMLVRKHTAAVAEFNEAWWKAYQEGSSRDQIAFPYALRQCGLQIHTIEQDVWSGKYLEFYWHSAFHGRGDVDAFKPAREIRACQMQALQDLVIGKAGPGAAGQGMAWHGGAWLGYVMQLCFI